MTPEREQQIREWPSYSSRRQAICRRVFGDFGPRKMPAPQDLEFTLDQVTLLELDLQEGRFMSPEWHKAHGKLLHYGYLCRPLPPDIEELYAPLEKELGGTNRLRLGIRCLIRESLPPED